MAVINWLWRICSFKKFFAFFSLSHGSFIAFICIFLRSTFFALYFLITVLKLHDRVNAQPSFVSWQGSEIFTEGDYIRHICMIYIFILLSEFHILTHTLYLGIGLITKNTFLLKLYLVNHMTAWSIQNIFFSVLTLKGKPPMSINSCIINAVLESYYILVVYNYYLHLSALEEKKTSDKERVFTCCCCFSLRIGSLIIGYVSLIMACLSISGVCTSLVKIVQYVKSQESRPNPQYPQQDLAKHALSQYISHAYFLLVLSYYFAISSMLVIGVHKNRASYMRYYFNTGLLLLVLASALVVVSFVFFGVIATVPLLMWSLTLFYCLVVVRSTYLDIEEQAKPRMQYEMHNLYVTPA